MPNYFHTLKRQISQLLETVDINEPHLQEFLQSVDEAYRKYERVQQTLENSLTESSEELVRTNEEITAVFQAIPDQLLHLDQDGRIISYKPGTQTHHYLISDKLIDQNLEQVFNREIVPKFKEAIQQVVQHKPSLVFEFIIVHDKRIYYYEARIMRVRSKQVIALIRDITERKRAEEQIAYLAFHDSLTGLPNNRLFKDRLQQAIAYANRNSSKVGVLFMDLDRFKLINDTMGHRVGDKLLQATADRLMEAVRGYDSIGINAGQVIQAQTSVARLGGDEFTILLEDINNLKDIVRVADRLTKTICKPIIIDDQEIYTSTSVGIAIYPDDGDDVDILLKHADTAMYHAKSQGRNNYQFFNATMNEASVQQFTMENALRKSIQNNELCLYYQPQINVVSGEVVGMEALIRWKHPERGFISPSTFIPLAEETGLIMEIGEWVLREACRQGAEWEQQGYRPVTLSVNLSAKQLRDEHINELIVKILFETGMNPKNLGIELTESALILDPDIAHQRLTSIKSLGVKLSLDDFGTGYSSLSYLKRFPIDTLKIDQTFIRDINNNHEDASLVKAIIAMAHGLGLDVVAEGVEHQEQLEFLGENTCDTIQGFLFSRPLPPADISKMLSIEN